MDAWLEANRANWDERVDVHARSEFYGVAAWLAEEPGPRPAEIEALGEVSGLTLVHLQCHFGMDTMQWARAGALVTGVDFSPAAVDEAIVLAARAGLSGSTRFVCCNVYDAPLVLDSQRFDIVYVSLGALCWLPEVAPWARVVADLLVPGGRLYLHDVHPFTFCVDDDGERIGFYSYFEEPDAPYVDDDGATYTDGGTIASTRNYQWNHSIAEIVGALHDAGIVLDVLEEHDWTVFQQFPWLEQTAPGRFTSPSDRPRIPLTFTILAHAPA
jgi:SAM-dependent methyltransferase